LENIGKVTPNFDLQNAPISQVATYAYVNPLVAVVLGWAILDEQLVVGMLAGAGLVVASVAAIVTRESAPRRAAAEERERAAQEERSVKQRAALDSVS